MNSLIILAALVAVYILWDLYHDEKVRKPACKEIDQGLRYLHEHRAIVKRVASRSHSHSQVRR